MFTGLIVELGEVIGLSRQGQNGRLTIRGKAILEGITLGDSIAVNGVCLTVVTISGDILTFDVSFLTLADTGLGSLKPGDRVNLESSLTSRSKIGGHFVSGHVDSVGRIRSRTREGTAERIVIEAAAEILRYLVPKGSIAVDGISLTVVEVLKDAFSIIIIPHTAALTTIGFKRSGETVNLEPDILAKYVARFLSTGGAECPSKAPSEEPLIEKLRRSGFL